MGREINKNEIWHLLSKVAPSQIGKELQYNKIITNSKYIREKHSDARHSVSLLTHYSYPSPYGFICIPNLPEWELSLGRVNQLAKNQIVNSSPRI